MRFAISFAFPPSFVICMYFFGLKSVTFWFAVFMFIYLLVLVWTKSSLAEIATPFIYFIFLMIAFIFNSIEFVKLIPVLISAGFFLLFVTAYVQKRELILKFTKKFYKKLTIKDERYIARSDGYWAFVTLANTLIQLALVFYDDNKLWAFYSSIGWYGFMFIALALQIAYGKLSRAH